MYKHLYEAFKHWYHGGAIYFYSDPHFNDADAWKFRKPDIWEKAEGNPKEEQKFYNWVEKWSEAQVLEINRVCHKNDTLVILGDVGDISYVSKLKAGYKVLIMGNHDLGASNYKRVITKSEMTIGLDGFTNPNPTSLYTTEDNHLFDEVYEGTLQIGPKLLLSHEPVIYPYCLNIHGHCHGTHGMINDGQHLNMCAEWIEYRPMSLTGIVKNGYLKEIPDVHRVTIDRAIERKAGREYEERSRKM